MQPPYPQYPQYPPAPQLPQPSSRWNWVRPVAIVSAAVTASLLLCCAGLTAINAFNSAFDAAFPHHPPAASAHLGTPTVTSQPIAATATSASLPTVTPSASAIVAPTLGGTADAFLASSRYQLVSGSRGQLYTATIAGERVLISLTLADPSQTTDGQPHIAVITAQVPGDALGAETWSGATADTIARSFLPSDAHFQRIVITGAVHDHIYRSAHLAATFHADQFTDDFGDALVPPGTLSYACHAWPPSAPGLGQCIIAIGSYNA